jgi:hypothetical protein
MRIKGAAPTRITWSGSRAPAALLAVLMSCVALTACGSASNGSACAGRAPMVDAAGQVSAGNCPVDLEVAIDRTAFGKGAQVGAELAQRALAAATGTLANGGLLSVTMYSRDADRPVVLYRGEAPQSEEGNQPDITDATNEIETALRTAIVSAFEPAAQQPPSVRQAMTVLEGSGSDVATSIGRGIERVAAAGGGAATAVVDLTDGWEAVPGLSLPQLIDRRSPHELSRMLVRAAGVQRHTAVGLLAMPTLGSVPVEYQIKQGSENTERLRQAWLGACHLLRAANCDIETA